MSAESVNTTQFNPEDLSASELEKHIATKEIKQNGGKATIMQWKSSEGTPISTQYMRIDSGKTPMWHKTVVSNEATTYFIQKGTIVISVLFPGGNIKEYVIGAGEMKEVPAGYNHKLYIAPHSSVQVLRGATNTSENDLGDIYYAKVANIKAKRENKKRPKKETGVSVRGQKMPNGEYRYRTMGTDKYGNDGSGCIITEAEPGTDGAWQNSHFHHGVQETYYVARGWMALAELLKNGKIKLRIFKAGDKVTTKVGVRHNVYMSEGAVTYTIKHGDVTPGAKDWHGESDEKKNSPGKRFHTATQNIPLKRLTDLINSTPTETFNME